jgi:hypothetical protein
VIPKDFHPDEIFQIKPSLIYELSFHNAFLSLPTHKPINPKTETNKQVAVIDFNAKLNSKEYDT